MFTPILSFIMLFFANGQAEPDQGESVRTMVIEQHLIVRVPVRARPGPALRWEEAKGPKCFPVGAIAGAFLSAPDSVDFILRGGQRVRAKLDSDCKGLDFYGSAYVLPEDRSVCARRDVIRSRMGGSCRIDKIKTLVPKPAN